MTVTGIQKSVLSQNQGGVMDKENANYDML